MRIQTLFSLAALLLASGAPALAADATAMNAGSMMMKPGEMMMMMPSGQTMMMPAMSGDMAAKDADMMKTATPLPDCVIMMMGKDGKMMMMHDMKMADGKMACDELSTMKK